MCLCDLLEVCVVITLGLVWLVYLLGFGVWGVCFAICVWFGVLAVGCFDLGLLALGGCFACVCGLLVGWFGSIVVAG